MSRNIYCGGCSKHVGTLSEGSLVMRDITYLCPTCETMRKASDLALKTKGSLKYDTSEMFGGLFRK